MVRVRFAPSPTGPLHIGGLRTALFNYFIARRYNGRFIIRIEDTDQKRYAPAAEQYIYEALKWLDILPDESPWQTGAYGPYRQSERKALYLDWIEKLIQTGQAYYAFDTPEELEQLRKETPTLQKYDATTRSKMSNSLTLSAVETQRHLESGDYTIRFKMPSDREVLVRDLVRGDIRVQTGTLDDKILIKSDGLPTYHFANVVDDHFMRISHVIRGEEWLASTPLHVLLYEALGWEETLPQFAHLPLLLKPSGKGKLSKRDGEKLDLPIFPLANSNLNVAKGFKEYGYAPAALLNFLSFLGWHPKTEVEELLTKAQITTLFDFEGINKAGVRFDIEKARWFNAQHLRQRSRASLGRDLLELLAKFNLKITSSQAEAIVELMRPRLSFLEDILRDAPYFFYPPQTYDRKLLKRCSKPETQRALRNFYNQIDNLKTWQSATILENIDHAHLGIVSKGQLLQALRLSVTGFGKGADLIGVLVYLGQNEVKRRLEKAFQNFETRGHRL